MSAKIVERHGRGRGSAAARLRLNLRFRELLFAISPRLLVEYRYLKYRKKRVNLTNPATFDEKLLWLMLYWRHPLKSRCADKYAVRSYVEECGLGRILPEFWGAYTQSREIDFSTLPEKFVLKCTHGCGFNILCNDRRTLDTEAARRKLDQWMKIDISRYGAELQYASIPPRIICEEYLEDSKATFLPDYKVYCFDGKAHCTMACTERVAGKAKYDFYDREWNEKLPYSRSSLLADRKIPKPAAYDEILAAAETLSRPFPFVRVDFYNVDGRAVFGEMTFTPHGCIDTGYTDLAQSVMGGLIRLPGKLPG